uniref:Uncharacterized protein n=1 Tax=Candidatus Kentrum sp. LFY TaxID=2126342 RepID=A0A450WXX6_9GAMM|nr:MAG: hypothetical protein BECKLFY1418A_GA0070994_108310 [Candidatus Kentron sp. LFY]VFK21875.1 MAG: hypothetical protein BECKLFY1418C_GA0070996_11058 [Candidatus Kentron sp. LFY]
MGELILPGKGSIYPDANCSIYSMERIESYCSILEPIWQKDGIVTSETRKVKLET